MNRLHASTLKMFTAALITALFCGCIQRPAPQPPAEAAPAPAAAPEVSTNAVPAEMAEAMPDEPAEPATPAGSAPEFDRENTRELGEESGLQPVYGDWIIRRLPAEMPHLNPITSTDAYASYFDQMIFDALTDVDPVTLEPIPLVAKSWEESEDHLTYTFHLRNDIKFTDGVPLTAKDVKFTFDKMMDPGVDAAHYRSYFVNVTSCETPDDYTVIFRCNEPYWLHLIYLGGLPILPEHIYAEGDFNDHAFARKPLGSGPYKFDKWDTGQQVSVARNADYWGIPEGHGGWINKWIFKVITDDNAAMTALSSGDLDLMSLTAEQWVRRADTPKFNSQFNKLQFYSPFYNYLGWNMRLPQFEDKRVRRALTMLLDRETIRETIFHGLAQPMVANFLPGTPEFNENLSPWPFDPAAATTLLDEAGWRDTNGNGIRDKDGVELQFEMLMINSSSEYERLATVFKEQLARAGIDMQLNLQEWASLIEKVHDRNFQAYMLGWSMPPFPDLYQLWHSSQADSGSNYVGFVNEEADQIIEGVRREFDRGKRIEMFRRFQEIVHEEQPYTFLYAPMSLVAVDKRVKNTVVYPLLRSRPYFEWFVPEDEQRYGK
ncbi:MAG: hypothetical protein GC168_00175 [Candidatus Hydrogenedens sp.]|nr:hypothetical protein [Candidatus Hydrogenedens sp.]